MEILLNIVSFGLGVLLYFHLEEKKKKKPKWWTPDMLDEKDGDL